MYELTGIPTVLVCAAGFLLGGLLLLVYQLRCLIDLLRDSDAGVSEPIERGVWAGLIVFLPAGLGGWLYDYVVHSKWISKLFLFALLLSLSSAIGFILNGGALDSPLLRYFAG